jgi:hypothetical protein
MDASVLHLATTGAFQSFEFHGGPAAPPSVEIDGFADLLAVGGIFPGNQASLGGGSGLWSGVGVPSSSLGSAGDFYFRKDTPSVANQRIYVNLGVGVWSGII